MGIGRAVQLAGRVHHLLGEGCRRVSNQRDMVSKLLRVARGRLGTGIGQQPYENDVTDAALFQLQVEVGVRETAALADSGAP